jgi:hypothetical protein
MVGAGLAPALAANPQFLLEPKYDCKRNKDTGMNEPNAQTLDEWFSCEAKEENGYDVPFAMFTWTRWCEMQVQTMQRFARFQRAIEHKQARLALQIALEMQQMTIGWLKEAGSWIESSEEP